MSGHRPWSELRRKHTNCLHEAGDTCVFCEKAEISDERTSTLPTFERCADKTLDEVRAIYAGRGIEYSDTWAEENACIHFTKEAFVMLASRPQRIEVREMQLLQLAALIDVKMSRMTGGYKSDTVADLIAYLACYKTLREEYG